MDIFKMKTYFFIFNFFWLVLFLMIYSFSEDLTNKANNLTETENTGIVSLTFDDGYLSQYKMAYPLMKQYGFNGSIFIMANFTGLFEGRDLIDFEQAKEMQDTGWEIGSHTLDHQSLNYLSDEKIEEQLSESKKILEKYGFKINSLAYPFGRFNNAVIETAEKYYSSARTTLEGYNDIGKLEIYKIKSRTLKQADTSKTICALIKKAKEENRWLVLIFHNIRDPPYNPWDISSGNFEKILKCISETQIEVKTIREVVDIYEI